MNKIVLAGKKGPHQQDRIIMTCGILPALTVGSHSNAQWMNLIIVPYHTMNKSKLNRYVRYIYRKMMRTFGKQKVREEALRIYVLTTKERARLKGSDDSLFSDEFKDGIASLLKEWQISGEYIIDSLAMFGTFEDLDQVLSDLTPIRVRIRKLTPKECMRLQGVTDEDYEKMKDAGLSNSALYKLAGNSICVAPLEGIFTQLMRQDMESLF